MSFQLTVPLYRSTQQLLSTYAIWLVLFFPGQDPLWIASIRATGNVENPPELLRKMALAAMQTFGADAERTFVMPCTDAAEENAGSCLP